MSHIEGRYLQIHGELYMEEAENVQSDIGEQVLVEIKHVGVSKS